MRLKIFALFAFAVITGCRENLQLNSKTNRIETAIDTTPNYADILKKKEREASERQTENIGALIQEITFSVKTGNKEDFENGIQPWASIEKTDLELPKLLDRNKIVLKDTIATLVIDYPLTNEYKAQLTSKGGFTKGKLLTEISSHYFRIYKDEENSATTKTVPIDKRTTVYNRNQTDGKYGIWGHDLADLALSGIMVYKNVDGKIILILEIES